jgi:tRNA pseudouridine55 synthase
MTDPQRAEPDGVLPVDKPSGPTSHDVVAMARRALHTRRVGHAGTLDPFASGLLLLCIGPSTRIAEYLAALEKTYHAVIRFGAATDTDDPTGEIIEEWTDWMALTETAVDAALQSLTGDVHQVPPVYSAKKVGGVPMHRLARAGRAPARTGARVTIRSIRLLRLALPLAEVEVTCSAGTYVRAIARDAGRALGGSAHLAELRRTRIGTHAVDHAVAATALADADAVHRAWIAPLDALEHLERVNVDAATARDIAHGRAVPAPGGVQGLRPIAIASGSRLIAVARLDQGLLKPRKVFEHV